MSGELSDLLKLWDRTDVLDAIVEEGEAGLPDVARPATVAGLALPAAGGRDPKGVAAPRPRARPRPRGPGAPAGRFRVRAELPRRAAGRVPRAGRHRGHLPAGGRAGPGRLLRRRDHVAPDVL